MDGQNSTLTLAQLIVWKIAHMQEIMLVKKLEMSLALWLLQLSVRVVSIIALKNRPTHHTLDPLLFQCTPLQLRFWSWLWFAFHCTYSWFHAASETHSHLQLALKSMKNKVKTAITQLSTKVPVTSRDLTIRVALIDSHWSWKKCLPSIMNTASVRPSFTNLLRLSNSFLELSPILLLTLDFGPFHLLTDSFLKSSSTWSLPSLLTCSILETLIQVAETLLPGLSLLHSSCGQHSGLLHSLSSCVWIKWSASCIASDSIGSRCRTSSTRVMDTHSPHSQPRVF